MVSERATAAAQRTRRNRKTLVAYSAVFVALGLAYAVWALLLRKPLSFPRSESDYYIEDKLLGHRHRPHASRRFAWPEHPKGQVEMRTNNLGFRHDFDLEAQKPANVRRILVAGDSHLDGVVHNSESFASRLESMLNRDAIPPARFQVLNAATGYYGPDHYAKTLDAYESLAPDALVVGFYTGNDFLHAAKLVENSRRERLPRPSDYMKRLRLADRVHPGALSQVLNQDYYFATYPEMRDAAIREAESQLMQLAQVARRQQVLLIVILLPAKNDIEPDKMGPEWAECLDKLELDASALRITPGMRIALAKRLLNAGVQCVDPTDALEKYPGELFWKKDYHLSETGQRALADYFYRTCGAQLIALE